MIVLSDHSQHATLRTCACRYAQTDRHVPKVKKRDASKVSGKICSDLLGRTLSMLRMQDNRCGAGSLPDPDGNIRCRVLKSKFDLRGECADGACRNKVPT